MGQKLRRWQSYVSVFLTNLGYSSANDVRLIISYVIKLLRSRHFDFQAAEDKLARRKFPKSVEQRQTTNALREVLYLEPGEEGPRRHRRTQSLSDHDPAAEYIQTDPALQLHQEQLAAEAMAALDSLPAKHREIYCKKVIEEMTYRELADEFGMSEGSLHKLVHEVQLKLAVLITKARNKNRRV